jgi:hypothetical protein
VAALEQLHLFPLPAGKALAATPAQLLVLDTVAYFDGLSPAGAVSRTALRRAIKKKFVEVVALGPARYRLTPIGRLVRGRAR